MSGKNLILCFDGTWNKPYEGKDPESSTDTNVCRLFRSIKPQSDDGRNQVRWYDHGVGTEWMNRLAGGAFGLGLDEHILRGYRELITNYAEGDRIYLFGFSRGAYAARSLVGLIRNAGLLHELNEYRMLEAYELYRARDNRPNAPSAVKFRQDYSREVDIHCLGAWDTVGALGVPVKLFDWFNEQEYGFHDTKLSKIVHNAFHAVAIDEHRKPYGAALWAPQDADDAHQRIEQVWFAGAHADVGGGYVSRGLANISLRWMQRRSQEAGLGVNVLGEVATTAGVPEHLSDVTDSFGQFAGGLWAKIDRRYYRPLGNKEDGPHKVHVTVLHRLRERPDYQPPNAGLAQLVYENRAIAEATPITDLVETRQAA